MIYFALYFAVRFFGYSLYAKYLNRLYEARVDVLAVGGCRVLVGALLGGAATAIMYATLDMGTGRAIIGPDTPIYLYVMVCVRLLVWTVIIRQFYTEQKFVFDERWVKGAGGGVIVSFLLAVPALSILLTPVLVC